MVRIVWTTPAAADIRAIAAFLDQHDPAAAQAIAAKLVRATDSLAEFPNRGRPSRNHERQLVTVPPYVITYRVVDDAVYIKSVRHGRRGPI